MWKNFFYYSIQQRFAVIIIIMITLLSVVIIIFSINRNRPNQNYEITKGDSIEEFLAGITEVEDSFKKSYSHPIKSQIELFVFDPNEIDSVDMIKLGIPYYVASNILKYRSKNGVFRKKEDFSKIYGLKRELFNTLSNYIIIGDKYSISKLKNIDTVPILKDTIQYKYPEGTLVDLNSADTTELKKIPGIGIGISKMILAYRKQLGGFYSVEQLDEIKYFNKDFKRWFTIKNNSIQTININKASLDRLRMHPYINFYQAKVIIEYRRKKGEIKNLSQLSLYEEFTKKDLKKLSNYLVTN